MGRRLDVLRLRVRSIARRAQVESDLERELAFHLEQEAEANRQLGITPEDARLAAVRRLGGVAQIEEECRDMRRTNTIENFVRDLQYAVRTLAKSPGFTVVLVLTLALSIGANSAIFSVIDGVLLRPLPYPDSDRIVRIFFRNANFPKFPLNPFDLRDMRARNRVFESLAGMTRGDRQLSGAGEPQRLRGFRITAGYFRVLGVAPARGREFNTRDELPANGDIAILSDRLWRAKFASDPDIIGRKIVIDAVPFIVVGVMPPGVPHPGNDYHSVADGDTVDVWTPFTFQGDGSNRGSHFIEGFARLKRGVSIAQVQTDLDTMVAQLAREHPNATQGWSGWILPLYDEMVRPTRRLLLVLLGAVGLVLLIACGNAANLLLVRATGRRREMAVRSALGAGRWRLVRQMLAESFVISAAAGVLGAALAAAGVKVLISLLPAGFPRTQSIHLDAGVFAFTLVAALGSGILFGLAPALQAARTDLQQGLRDSARGSTASGGQVWLRGALVVGEIGLACLLLIGAGLMLRSFVNLLRTDPGFRPEHVITAAITVPDATYKKDEDLMTFFERLRVHLNEAPGVRQAGLATDLPWTGYDENVGGFTIEGRQPPPHTEFHARYHAADPGYFGALGVPLIRGRLFDAHDDKNSRRVLIINRAMAQSYWGSDDAVGGRISFDDHPQEKDWITVVGVVGNIKDHPNSASTVPAMWWPILQMPWRFTDMSVAVRTNGDPAGAAAQIRDAVHQLNPNLAVADVRSMDDVTGESYSTPRFGLFLVALFAMLAVVLAAIGIYGVISYSVGQRTQEFGVRVALGARSWDILQNVMSHGLKLAAAGIAIGIVGALLLSRVLRALLYEVSSTDPITYAMVAAAAIGIAAAACYVPARRATNADPMTALRAE